MNCAPEDNGKHQLQVRNLHVHYGSICALQNIDLDVRCGTRVGIFGPNGAGKSTLLKVIAGLIPHAEGEILWNNQPFGKSRREIAYLPQREEADFTFPITVRGVIEMGRYPDLGLFRRFRASDRDAVDQAVETMGLQDLQSRQIRALSGGQQQRVFLARALAQHAHVLLLDEPFTGLDAPSRELLTTIIHELANQGRLIMCTHHGLDEAERLFGHILILNRSLVASGSPELLRDPKTRALAQL